MIRKLAVLASGALISACGPARNSMPTAAPAVVPTPGVVTLPVTSVSAPAPVSTDARVARVAEMLSTMARLRSLPATGSVEGKTIDRATMIAQLKKHVREEIPADALRGQGEFLRAFGLIPKDFDFEQGIYGLVESQLAGYYDPDDKAMFLMSDLSRQEADATLAHELVHALQDQHYDLGPRLKYRVDANDSQSALQSLAEGDATSAMLDYMLDSDGKDALSVPDFVLDLQISASMAVSPDLARFPQILRNSLVSPYLDGVRFVHALRRRGGWAAVDAVWKNPPETTEQLLHLEKLDRRERPETVPVPTAAALGTDWQTSYFDIYGEQGLRVALEDWLPKKVAASAAQGWAGDHAMVAVRHTPSGDEQVGAWRIRFDPGEPPQKRSAEALEAFVAIARAWDAKAATLGPICKSLPDGTPVALLTRDRDVVLVGGAGLKHLTGQNTACSHAIRWGTAILSSP